MYLTDLVDDPTQIVYVHVNFDQSCHTAGCERPVSTRLVYIVYSSFCKSILDLIGGRGGCIIVKYICGDCYYRKCKYDKDGNRLAYILELHDEYDAPLKTICREMADTNVLINRPDLADMLYEKCKK